MRNSRASCSASTTSGGNSRPASMRAAAAASAGASARALATQSALTRRSMIRPWGALVFSQYHYTRLPHRMATAELDGHGFVLLTGLRQFLRETPCAVRLIHRLT